MSYSKTKRSFWLFACLISLLLSGCAGTKSENNSDYLSLFFTEGKKQSETILLEFTRILDEFALIINTRSLSFKEGQKFEILRNDQPVGLASVVKIQGEKIVVKASLDDKNGALLLTDKIRYIIDLN